MQNLIIFIARCKRERERERESEREGERERELCVQLTQFSLVKIGEKVVNHKRQKREDQINTYKCMF